MAIFDIRMPPGNADDGLVAAQEIRRAHPDVGVLVLSHHLESRYAMRLLDERPSASATCSRNGCPTSRCWSTRCAASTRASAWSIRRSCAAHERAARQGPLDELTEREREVLALMAEGHSNQGICDALVLSPKTVEGHVRQIFMKLGLREVPDQHRRVQAVLAFLRSPQS